ARRCRRRCATACSIRWCPCASIGRRPARTSGSACISCASSANSTADTRSRATSRAASRPGSRFEEEKGEGRRVKGETTRHPFLFSSFESAEIQRDEDADVAALDEQRELVVVAADLLAQRFDAVDRLAVHREDHVAGANPRAARGAGGVLDQQAALLDVRAPAFIVVERTQIG